MINQDIWPDHVGPQRHNGHTPSKASSPDPMEPDAVPNNDEHPENDTVPLTTQAEGSVRPAQ